MFFVLQTAAVARLCQVMVDGDCSWWDESYESTHCHCLQKPPTACVCSQLAICVVLYGLLQRYELCGCMLGFAQTLPGWANVNGQEGPSRSQHSTAHRSLLWGCSQMCDMYAAQLCRNINYMHPHLVEHCCRS